MKKREFQKKATIVLLKKIVSVNSKMNKNPNITVSTRYNSTYFKLKEDNNLIEIYVNQTGELNYKLTDCIGITGEKQNYYSYNENDDLEAVIKKFADDFGRLYKDLLVARTLHDFECIKLSYDKNSDDELNEYEYLIKHKECGYC